MLRREYFFEIVLQDKLCDNLWTTSRRRKKAAKWMVQLRQLPGGIDEQKRAALLSGEIKSWRIWNENLW